MNTLVLKALGVGAAFIAVVGILMVPFAHVGVAEGHVAVETNKGAATGEVYQPGWQFQNPVTEGAHHISIRPETVTMNGKDNVTVITEDGQDVYIDVTVRYRVNESQAVTFYKEYKTHKKVRKDLIKPTLRSDLRDEASAVPVREVITKDGRESLKEVARESLQENFEGSGLELEAVQIRDVQPNKQYSQQLENIEVEKAAKEQRKIQAEKKAEAQKIEAQGEAEAEIERAKGDAQAAKIRDEQLTQKVLTDKWLDTIDDSDKVIINGAPQVGANATANASANASSPDLIVDASEGR